MAPDVRASGASGTHCLWSGILVGIGLASFVDEIVFHQLLHWHHFWDGSGGSAALVSDGGLAAFNLMALVGGFFWLADLRRRPGFRWPRWLGSLLVGLGGFQLWDGLGDHKLLRLHQVRYGVHLLPYDVAWNAVGALVLLAGAVLLAALRRAGRTPSLDAARAPHPGAGHDQRR